MQEDPVKNISNMRTAIANTNVVLNLVVCPGIILVPSSMTILKKRVAGYNNYLTLATKDMKFGVNEDVNRVVVSREPTTTSQQKEEDPVLQTNNENERFPESGTLREPQAPVISTTEKNPVNRAQRGSVLPTLGGAIAAGFLIAKYVI